MVGFSLDDVRDSFVADVTRALRHVDALGRSLLETPQLSAPAAPPQAGGQPPFESLAHDFHAIHGTSALLTLDSLREGSQLLEALAETGQRELDELQRRAASARGLAEALLQGSRELAQMVELELLHRGDEARVLSQRLLRDLAPLLPQAVPVGPVALPAPPADEPAFEFGAPDEPAEPGAAPTEEPEPEFDFGVDAAALPGAPDALPDASSEYAFDEAVSLAASAPSLGDELVDVFRQEARESLVSLHGYLQALASDPSDAEAARSLERLFHTFKGAAATVGLGHVAALASDLRQSVEAALEHGAAAVPGFVPDLVARTNRLLLASGLQELSLEGVEKLLPSEGPIDLFTLFLDEARQTCAQVAEQLIELADVPRAPEQRGDTLQALGRLFHRLKGSAALASASGVAEEAAELQRLCEVAEGHEALEGLTRGFARIRQLLEAPGAVAAPTALEPPSQSPSDSAALSALPGPLREPITLDNDPSVWEAFEAESAELLEALDRAIFALEESAQPKDLLPGLLRYYHTLKGAANTVGVKPLGRLLHRVEDFVEELQRAPILPPLGGLVELFLGVQARTRAALRDALSGFVETDQRALEAAITALRMRGRRAAGDSAEGSSSWRRPPAVQGGRSGAPSFDSLESPEPKAIRVAVERLDALMNLTGELVVSRSRLVRRLGGLRTLQRELKAGRGRLLAVVERFHEKYEFALGAGRGAFGRGPALLDGPRSTVAPEGFSELELDTYGDVNILARSLNEIGSGVSEVQERIDTVLEAFSEDSVGFGATVSSLQQELTRARMVPVDQLFLRLRLPIREAAEHGDKQVRVRTAGEQVALDKTLMDQLYLPLLHLVRNAVAHGIEAPARRRALGKDPIGTITLQARQESGQIVIEVRDDGAGLDLRRLHALAVRAGALPPDTPLEHALVHDAIFLPGLSTRTDVDDVAGRGVGGEVARREIERLNGSIHARGQAGSGTTVTLTLPLTLVVTRALLVRQRGQVYAFPLNFAERIHDLSELELHDAAGSGQVKLGDGFEKLLPFEGVLRPGPRATVDTAGNAVVLRVGDRRVVVAVERVLGQEEVVVKGLGDVVSGHPLFSGVTVSGEGDLILIVDVPALLATHGAHTSVPAGRAAESAGAPPLAPEAERSGQTLRVLFVDDSLSVRKVAEKFLLALGVDVALAVDGQDALVRLQKQRFDLVFTDLEMPRVHGYELIREMRANEALRDLPVVVVTSRSGQKHRDQAQALGASEYITKPFTQDTLRESLARWVPGGLV